MKMRHAHVLSAVAALMMASPAAAEDVELEPYKLVRSLQRLQDQIAEGDKSALGMQREMVRLIDESFRKIDEEALGDPRNARALISYSLGGGNPSTLERLLPRLGSEEDEIVQIGIAVLVYQKGAADAAATRLGELDPKRYHGLLGAGLALIRGMVAKDERAGVRDLNLARLLGPGTLIEEAALRRLLVIHRNLDDPDAFLHIASQYARRFIESPYALQFARDFMTGVVDMDPRTDRETVMEILDFMPPRYREAMRMRLVRQATLEGRTGLVQFLTRNAPSGEDLMAETGDPDQLEPDTVSEPEDFYSLVSQITSENVGEIAVKLRGIDAATLPQSDRDLLQAVLAVAGAVTEPVAPGLGGKGADEVALAEPVEAIDTTTAENPGGESKSEDMDESDPELSEFTGFITDARKTLEDVDKILEDAQ